MTHAHAWRQWFCTTLRHGTFWPWQRATHFDFSIQKLLSTFFSQTLCKVFPTSIRKIKACRKLQRIFFSVFFWIDFWKKYKQLITACFCFFHETFFENKLNKSKFSKNDQKLSLLGKKIELPVIGWNLTH